MKEMRSDLIVSSIEGPEGRVLIPAPKIPRSFPIRVGSEQGFEYEICSESPEIDPQSILLGAGQPLGTLVHHILLSWYIGRPLSIDSSHRATGGIWEQFYW